MPCGPWYDAAAALRQQSDVEVPMQVPHRLASLLLVGLLVLPVAPAGAQGQADAAGEAEAATGLVEVFAETMVVGQEGSHRAGRDRAVLAPGRTGLLRTETSLPPGAAEPVDVVSVDLKIQVRQVTEGLEISVDSTARGGPSGEVVLRSGGGIVSESGPLFYEAYVSPVTGDRVVFLLGARPWAEEADALAPVPATEPVPVAYRLWIYRLTEAGRDLVESPNLGSLVGHTASYRFGFQLAAPGEESHREELNLLIRAVDLRDGLLTGVLTLEGHLSGVPVRRSRTWSLPSGGETELEVRLEEVPGGDLGFHFVLAALFQGP
jgi:hypothetical protein